MKAIPDATPITLTEEERAMLEALKGSTKSQARMRDRARIVFLAAAGAATREIGGSAAQLERRRNGGYATLGIVLLASMRPGAQSKRALPLHPDQRLMAQPDRNMVLDSADGSGGQRKNLRIRQDELENAAGRSACGELARSRR
jgi:hypothetical protein